MAKQKKTILIGVSSGIAAFKIVPLVRDLRKRGYETIVLMTENARKMVDDKEFERASGNPVAHELFPEGFDYKQILVSRSVEHISLADRATLLCIAPATANIVAKLAHGIADDLLTTVALATRAPVLLCPSMNVNMWNKAITRANIAVLKERGYQVLEPAQGQLACGYVGQGRLPEASVIKKEILQILSRGKELAGKRILVTAGGTEEPIDDVRLISNRSSGKMGIAIANECLRRGAKVLLIHGRTNVELPPAAECIRVGTAHEMQVEINRRIKKCDAIIHAAAVSDYRVANPQIGKKLDSRSKTITLELISNPKIIDSLKKRNPSAVLVGFKAVVNQTPRRTIQIAKELLRRTSADLIVANDVGKSPVFGRDENEVALVFARRKTRQLKRAAKTKIAETIVDEVSRLIRR